MDGYIILSIFFGITIIVFALFSIKKDLEKGEKIILQSEYNINRLDNLLKEANETIEEIDAFGEYIVDRIENKTKWALEMLSTVTKENQVKKQDEISTEVNNIEKQYTSQNEEKNMGKVDEDTKKESMPEIKVSKIEEKYKKVLDLYQSGMDIDQIASKLSLGKGEVRLAIRIIGGKDK